MSDPLYNRMHRWRKHRARFRRQSVARHSFSHVQRAAHRWRPVFGIVFSKGFFVNALLLFAVAAVAAIVLFGILFFALGRNLPDPNALQDRSVAQSTKILDRTGEHILYEIHGDEKRTLVKLEELPPALVQGVVATEDTKFYSHIGIRPLSMGRAVLYGLLPGKRIEGTSTLTQQLVKNAILNNERTFARKLKEIILSLRLEQKYSKEEILQIYFNEIPYGSTNYGVESAAQSYFGKRAAELSLAEAATLAGMPKAPTSYLNNPDRLLERRNFVLRRMFEESYISEAQKNEAQALELGMRRAPEQITAPHFVFFVKQLLEELYGQREVEEGGLKVTTTIDYDLQVAAEEAAAKAVDERGESLGFTNIALVAIDPKNGQIVSMVGSHDYFDEENDGAVNVALRPRQPGSSIKPMVYSALFEKGFTPNTVLYDVETDFPTPVGTYHPRNFDLKERGPLTVRSALQGSLNIPAVKALHLVGIDSFLAFAKRMGYSTFEDRSRFGLAVALGGGEVTLLEHTSAYATLANDGVRHEPVPMLKVESPGGEVLFEWKEAPGERVVDANVARMTSNVLSDDAARQYIFGANSLLQLGGRPVAAKTGTTNDYHDAWTMGYTPSIAVGVWGGNNDNKPMGRGSGGTMVTGPVWNTTIRKAVEGTPVQSFAAPEIPKLGKPVLDGEIGSPKTLMIDRITGKLATDETPVRLREERTYVTHHNILHYVDPANLQGPEPGAKSNDPMYPFWEQGVQDWVKRKAEESGQTVATEEPPTEYDDVHVAANIPDVEIQEPESVALESRTFRVEARVSARREVERVEVYVDSYFLGATTHSPYSVLVTLPAFVSAGEHTLRVGAFDDVENEGWASMEVQVSPSEAASIQITDPRPGQIIVASAPTYPVRLELADPALYSRVDFYVGPRVGGGGSRVGSIDAPTSSIETFVWTLPPAGEYILSATAIRADTGEEISAGSVLLEVEAPLTAVTL